MLCFILRLSPSMKTNTVQCELYSISNCFLQHIVFDTDRNNHRISCTLISSKVFHHEHTLSLSVQILIPKLEFIQPMSTPLEQKLFAHLRLMLHVNFAIEIAMFCYSFTVSFPLLPPPHAWCNSCKFCQPKLALLLGYLMFRLGTYFYFKLRLT